VGVGLGRGLFLSGSLPHVSWNLLGLWGEANGKWEMIFLLVK